MAKPTIIGSKQQNYPIFLSLLTKNLCFEHEMPRTKRYEDLESVQPLGSLFPGITENLQSNIHHEHTDKNATEEKQQASK